MTNFSRIALSAALFCSSTFFCARLPFHFGDLEMAGTKKKAFLKCTTVATPTINFLVTHAVYWACVPPEGTNQTWEGAQNFERVYFLLLVVLTHHLLRYLFGFLFRNQLFWISRFPCFLVKNLLNWKQRYHRC